MAPKNRVIIDTDPGVDDVLALLLALSASPEELEVVMISVTYGNVEVQSCLRNVVTLFHVLDKELEWRKSTGRALGYETMRKLKPIVAVGAQRPLFEETLMADFFHGIDGLHGVSDKYPQLCPADSWESLFRASAEGEDAAAPPLPYSDYFTASKAPAHQEMLRILRENPADTITIVTIGPLTNVALAAAEDPETLLRVKELVVMGGAVDVKGNITPVAEFNSYSDSVAAARVYALTSPQPQSTMPPLTGSERVPGLGPYPDALSRTLRLTLFPLDVTSPHLVTKSQFCDRIRPALEAGSPLAQWTAHFVLISFGQEDSFTAKIREPCLSLHDPVPIWYVLTRDDPRWVTTAGLEDIRVESAGQWTRGMHIVDRRCRAKPGEAAVLAKLSDADVAAVDTVPGDTMSWLSVRKGNRISRMVGSPGEHVAAEFMMERIFG